MLTSPPLTSSRYKTYDVIGQPPKITGVLQLAVKVVLVTDEITGIDMLVGGIQAYTLVTAL